MEVEVSKENVCINKLICEKKELIFVEEDMIVPDSKPDILNTINMNGNVCIYKKEAQDEKVKIDGCVNTYIMYLPDSKEDNIRGLNANIDFSQSIQVPECREGMTLLVCVAVKDMECKVLNGRKINVRAGLEVRIKLYSNDDVNIINRINNIPDIQTLDKKFKINSLVGSGSTRVYVKDTLNIDAQDELAEILKTEINLVDKDIKISYNKVLAKAEVDIKIMYLTEDNRINTIQGRIPAVGFIDIQDISEDNICDINYEIGNILLRPNSSEEHSIYVEIELETSCMTYQEKEINLIQDLYSPTIDLEFDQRKITTTTNKMMRTKNFTITSKTNIADLRDGSLIDVEVRSVINKEQITNTKILYEGDLVLNFIFTKETNVTNSKILKIPFDFSIDNPVSTDRINLDTQISIASKKFDVRENGDVECNVDMDFALEISQVMSMNIVDDIRIIESRDVKTEEYDSLIIYIVQRGDTLWNIAKKFRSTIDDIARTNGIENPDKINVGQKLYIPKFKYMTQNATDDVASRV